MRKVHLACYDYFAVLTFYRIIEYKSLITASENVLNYKVNTYNYNVFEFQLEVKFLAFISFIHDS